MAASSKADFEEDLMTICTQGLVPPGVVSNVPDYDCCDTFDDLLAQVTVPDGPQEPQGRFATPAIDDQVLQAQKAAIPENTKKSTSRAVNVWKAWSKHRRTVSNVRCPSHLLIMANNKWEMNYWLTRFVLEARRKDGKEYPPNTLHQIVCGVQRYVRELVPDIDFFSDTAFADFRKTEMKHLRGSGLGCNPKKADPIALSEEERLWNGGMLGDSTPKTLVNTIIECPPCQVV